jgi:hypothetical protein
MTVFADKLNRLPATLALAPDGPAVLLAEVLRESRGRTAVAVGLGSSAVTAEYFARCRSTLGLGRTLIQTPMELVLGDDLAGDEVWLFSGAADSPDISAAFRAALGSTFGPVRLVTVRPDSPRAIEVAAHPRGKVITVPVADLKDGFLATHSTMAIIAALLLASDLLTEQPRGSTLAVSLSEGAARTMSDAGDSVSTFRSGDALLILHDPQVKAAAVLVETSLWQTGIAPVQRVDFRNFAHACHVWTTRHPSSMLVLALTAAESVRVWEPISNVLPADVRKGTLHFGSAGRFQLARGILAGLGIVRALGERTGIDPGRPERGGLALTIYENGELEVLAHALTPAVRRKRRALLVDDPDDVSGPPADAHSSTAIETLSS